MSKLVAFAKNKWDEPLYNGCYSCLLSVDPKPHSTIDCLNANMNKVLRARVIKDRAKQQVRILKRPKLSHWLFKKVSESQADHQRSDQLKAVATVLKS